MSVETKLVGRNSKNQVTVLFTVIDTTTNTPVEGATIVLYDEDLNPPLQKAKGVTGANGTIQLTYMQCLDPETKTPLECSGRARKERYQDVYFTTPYQ